MPNTYVIDAADNTGGRAAADDPKSFDGTTYSDDTSIKVLTPAAGAQPVSANSVVVDDKARKAAVLTLTTRLPIDSKAYTQTDGSTMPSSAI